MSFIEIILIAIGLSVDSLAVCVTSGAVMQNCSIKRTSEIGLVMGLFQAGMAAAGYLAGLGFQKYISAFDHWVAFGLLSYLGCKMIYEGMKEETEDTSGYQLSNKRLVGIAFATSIDAMAVGISLAILGSPLLLQTAIIGVITFLLSAFGIYFGCRFGQRFDLKLDLIGGLILIAIGAKILIEHLFIN